MEVNLVLEALGKDLNVLHKHLFYLQISQNLEFLQLFINLIPFNEKKESKTKTSSKETQTGQDLTLQNSINNQENILSPSENPPEDLMSADE